MMSTSKEVLFDLVRNRFFRAARETFGHFNEVFCVDLSNEMHNVARIILQGGKKGDHLSAGHFFRMHLPQSAEVKHDLIEIWLK